MIPVEGFAPGAKIVYGNVDGIDYPKYALIKNPITGEDEIRYTKVYLEVSAKAKARRELQKVGIESEILSKTLDSYRGEDKPENIPKLSAFVNKFKEKHKTTHLYLWSPQNSTQKSTTAKIVAKDIFLQGFSVRFVTMGTLTHALKEESFDPEVYRPLTDDCREVDLLVVDDCFDSKKMGLYKSGYQISFLDSFFRDRLEVYRRSTIFTSNVDPNTLSESFGVSLQALITRSAWIMPFNDLWDKIDFSNLWGD